MVCLKTNGDSAQLPVPATPSITRQHMYGSDNVVHWKQKYAFARPSKPQHMGRTLKHSREGELKPQDAMHRDNCCPFTCHWKKIETTREMSHWATPVLVRYGHSFIINPSPGSGSGNPFWSDQICIQLCVCSKSDSGWFESKHKESRWQVWCGRRSTSWNGKHKHPGLCPLLL